MPPQANSVAPETAAVLLSIGQKANSGQKSNISEDTQNALLALPGHKNLSKYDKISPSVAQEPQNLEVWTPFGNLNTHIPMPKETTQQLEGIGQGIHSVSQHLGNLVGLVPNQQLKNSAAIDKPLLETGNGLMGSIGGQTMALAPATLGAEGALGEAAATKGIPIVARVSKIVLGNPIARGALQGAIQGAVMGAPGNKLASTAEGAGIGGVIPGIRKGVGKLATGLARTGAAQRLLNRGVALPPGLLKPRGALNYVAEGLESNPLTGPFIKPARITAQNEAMQAAMQHGAPPGVTLDRGPLSNMLTQAYTKFNEAYAPFKGYQVNDRVLSDMTGNRPGTPAIASLQKLMRNAAESPKVTAEAAPRKAVAARLKDMLTAIPRKLSTGDLIGLRSKVRGEIRATADPEKRALFQNAADKITDLLHGGLLPRGATDDLMKVDARYHDYKTLEDAVASMKDNEAMTPNQLSSAIKRNAPKPYYARGGGGAIRQTAKDIHDVFEQQTRPTGVRNFMTMLPYGMGLLDYLMPGSRHIVEGTGAGLFGLLGTQAGRRLAAGQTGTQEAARRFLNRLAANQTPAAASLRRIAPLALASGVNRR